LSLSRFCPDIVVFFSCLCPAIEGWISGENATNNGPFFCSRMPSQASSAPTAQAGSRVAAPDRHDQEAGPAEVEVLDVESGDLGPPASGSGSQQ